MPLHAMYAVVNARLVNNVFQLFFQREVPGAQ